MHIYLERGQVTADVTPSLISVANDIDISVTKTLRFKSLSITFAVVNGNYSRTVTSALSLIILIILLKMA